MAAQRKNLLEAFKNAGDLPEPKDTRPQPNYTPPPAPAPKPSLFENFKKKRAAKAAASRPERSLAEGQVRPASRRASRSMRMPSTSILPGDIPPALLLAAGAGVVLAFGVVIGRASRPEVEAAGSDGDITELSGERHNDPNLGGGLRREGSGIVPAGSGAPGPGMQAPRNMGTRGTRDTLDADEKTTKIEDSPLFDSANLYTIIVQTYTHSNSDHAWATFEHLRSEGFSVFPPVVKDEYLLILVGAAPRGKDLLPVEERIRTLLRDGEYAYHDAYRVPIDNYIER